MKIGLHRQQLCNLCDLFFFVRWIVYIHVLLLFSCLYLIIVRGRYDNSLLVCRCLGSGRAEGKAGRQPTSHATPEIYPGLPLPRLTQHRPPPCQQLPCPGPSDVRRTWAKLARMSHINRSSDRLGRSLVWFGPADDRSIPGALRW